MLVLKNVNLAIKNVNLLKDINLELETGKIYGLLGPNGSGKTTLFKSILGLTKYEGSISSCGKPVLANDVGNMIEYPAFYSNLTVYENLHLHAKYMQLKKYDIEQGLKQVDLWDARNKRFSQLSLGMKQRLGIARAFLSNAKYLLLDEPTNGLDPLGIKDIRLLLKGVLKTKENTIVVSSHNLTEIVAIVDVLIFIKNGEIVLVKDNNYENEKELELMYENIMSDKKGGIEL